MALVVSSVYVPRKGHGTDTENGKRCWEGCRAASSQDLVPRAVPRAVEYLAGRDASGRVRNPLFEDADAGEGMKKLAQRCEKASSEENDAHCGWVRRTSHPDSSTSPRALGRSNSSTHSHPLARTSPQNALPCWPWEGRGPPLHPRGLLAQKTVGKGKGSSQATMTPVNVRLGNLCDAKICPGPCVNLCEVRALSIGKMTQLPSKSKGKAKGKGKGKATSKATKDNSEDCMVLYVGIPTDGGFDPPATPHC